MRNVSEIAQAAIDALNTYGWLKYEGGSPDRGFCALGAINYASDSRNPGHEDSSKEFRATRIALAKVVGTHHIADWNDYKCRSKDDVIAALQKVIDDAKAIEAA